METKNEKTKITNLFEDGNYHEHDEKSYQKMSEHMNTNITENKE